ncbi:hypothetical protein [Clostridium sp. HBUAS56010]|uniref:hypothetical protein n=1 Tax=Clostridium sp. HBUAS56010 TaxID=2571127 RepID=UPI0011783CA2|nr:hypothetical protein [Clostridium sp. HBUAS56010]
MKLIKTPKTLYFRWLKGEQYEPQYLIETIDEAMEMAEKLKKKYQLEKLNLSWEDYKKLIEKYFFKIFDNCICLDDYEDKTKIVVQTEAWHEDNFYISYFCKTLDGYMRNYQKEYYGLYVAGSKDNYILKRCSKCGSLFNQKSNNQKLCKKCSAYTPIGTKIINCVDCGKDVEVNSKDNKTDRCQNCYKEYRKNKVLINVKNYRNRKCNQSK